jgi:predicted O-methyltransferase YrrM
MITNEKVVHYLEHLIQDRTEFLQQLEQFAQENSVPIMDVVGMETMLQILRLHKPKRIFEIGTAIGYSAIRMALALPGVQVVSVERDEIRYQQAVENIKKAGLENRITVVFGDALEVYADIKDMEPFDSIFIDAAKGQYQKFFEYYQTCLTESGVIISDNVLFKGIVAEEEVENKRIKTMVRKLKTFNEFIINHPSYDTAILPVGDGIAISVKK